MDKKFFVEQGNHAITICVEVTLVKGDRGESKQLIISANETKKHKFSDVALSFQNEVYNAIVTLAKEVS